MVCSCSTITSIEKLSFIKFEILRYNSMVLPTNSLDTQQAVYWYYFQIQVFHFMQVPCAPWAQAKCPPSSSQASTPVPISRDTQLGMWRSGPGMWLTCPAGSTRSETTRSPGSGTGTLQYSLLMATLLSMIGESLSSRLRGEETGFCQSRECHWIRFIKVEVPSNTNCTRHG